MASGNPSSMMATTERPLPDVDCLDNHPRMEVRDPAKEISEQMATHHLSPPPPPPLVKGGGRLSKGIWEIIKGRNSQGAKDLRELAELNSRQYKLEHGMSSANPSPMMATTKRPRVYVCFGNNQRREISEEQITGGYHLWGSPPPPPPKKGKANNLGGLSEFSRRQSQLEHDRVMPILQAYQKEVDESDGFDVGDYRAKIPPTYAGMIVPMNYSKAELADKFNVHCKSAIELYNKTMGAKFKVVEIEKANFAGPRTHFITFTASEENDEPKVFQAEHLMGCPMGPPTVTLCRQKGDRLGGYRRTDMYP